MQKITKHAEQRLKERANIKSSKENVVQRALLKGKTIENFDNRTQKYLCNVLSAGSQGDKFLRVFGGNIYIFGANKALITILNLPEKINKQIGLSK